MSEIEMISVGNKGPKIKSDCAVTFELRSSGGRDIKVISKVETMFGDDIRRNINEILDFFGIEHCGLLLEDTGALPYVIAARMEAAIKKAIKVEIEFFLPMLEENENETAKDKRRFSRLYLPGNSPSLFINAGIHHPDGIILDLEDAVAPDKKYEARYLVRNALRSVNFYGAERMVRINQIPMGLDDLDYVIPHNVNLILVPKCETAEQIRLVNERIKIIQQQNGTNRAVWLMPIIESALGVLNAYQICTAAENVCSVAIGLEDFTADLGVKRTNEGSESFVARSLVVLAAKAAGVQAIDSVFSDIDDMEAMKNNVLVSKAMGFNGMGIIHPRQIRVVHEYFGPDVAEIEKAKKIVLAFDDATAKGLGVVSLGSKMIDPPVVKRALQTIELALNMGKLESNWKELV